MSHLPARTTLPDRLLQIIESTTLTAEQIAARTAEIHALVLSKSPYIDAPNFTRIHPDDLELILAEYDGRFFGGQIRETLGSTPGKTVGSCRDSEGIERESFRFYSSVNRILLSAGPALHYNVNQHFPWRTNNEAS